MSLYKDRWSDLEEGSFGNLGVDLSLLLCVVLGWFRNKDGETG